MASSPFTEPMYILTLVGAPELWAGLALCLLALYFMFRGRLGRGRAAFKRFLLVLIPSLALFLIITLLLKAVFVVGRPCTPCTMIQDICNPYCPVNDPSFPSAHAGVAFVAFTSLWLLRREAWHLPVFIVPLGVAYSRLALGVHSWIDAAVGAAVGLIVTILVWRELHERPVYGQKRYGAGRHARV